MTQTIEQERAEFERTIGVDYDLTPSTIRQGQYAVPVTQAAWYGWQAARRAPAVPVPQGWKLAPEIPTQSMCDAAKYQVHSGLSVFKWADGYSAMLAAAPQPPEAAPVQLPEPEANVHAKLGNTCMFPSTNMRKGDKIYTEQQVRQLLAVHGIEVAP